MKTINIEDYTVGPSECFMFDTNVWLHIFAPIAGSRPDRQKKYSNFLAQILSRKAGLYITSLILSEYINRVLRLGFSQWKISEDKMEARFKEDYRNTTHYQAMLQDAVSQINDILKITQRRPDDFNAIDIEELLNSMDSHCDYNDAYIIQCCEKGKIKLVSDDKDFQQVSSTITLITAQN